MENDIKCYVLINGKTIISKIIAETETEVKCEQVHELAPHPTPDGRSLSIALIPFFISNPKSNGIFKKNLILAEAEIDLGLERVYMNQISTIKTPPSGVKSSLLNKS